MSDAVNGNCPACGQLSLRFSNGEILCGFLDCPTPDAVASLLREPNIVDHVVEFRDIDDGGGWTMRHPMAERLNDGLFRCSTAAALYGDTGGSIKPGRYVVRVDVGGIIFVPMEEDLRG